MTTEPRDNQRRVLAAARKLFFQRGFSATSSALLAREAGTSKATIYSRWGSMEGLLDAVIAAEVDRFDASASDEIMDFESFRSALVGLGERLLQFLSEPETVRFSQMMHEEARRIPAATRAYFAAAYEGTAARIDGMMEAGRPFVRPAPLLDLPDRGERYVAQLKGHRYEMATLGLVERPFKDPTINSEICFDAWFSPRF